MNFIRHVALAILGSSLLQINAMTPTPHLDGFAMIEVLETKQDVILCVLRVSGGATTELLAIHPEEPPQILWRVSSTKEIWHGMSVKTNEVYTIEGTILQRRRKSDGLILAKRDLAVIDTPISIRRPWTKFEERVAQKKSLLETADGETKEKLLSEIANLKVDIEIKKSEWLRDSKIAAMVGDEKEGEWYSFSFLSCTKDSLRVSRMKFRYTTSGSTELFSEILDLNPNDFIFLSSSLHQPGDDGKFQRPSGVTADSYNLSVIGNRKHKTMDVDSIRHNLFLKAIDPESHEEMWKLKIPVEIKRIQ